MRENRSLGVMEKCSPDNGLIFDKSDVVSSIAIQYKFLCNDDLSEDLLGILGATYMIGMLLGSFVIGLVSDYFGRMKALMLSIILVAVAGSLGAFMPDPIRYVRTNSTSTTIIIIQSRVNHIPLASEASDSFVSSRAWEGSDVSW